MIQVTFLAIVMALGIAPAGVSPREADEAAVLRQLETVWNQAHVRGDLAHPRFQ